MSEYASAKHSKNETLIDESIFDDKLLDEVAERMGSYDEARRVLGIKAPEYSTPEPGAFVTLDARAIAVRGLMEGINLANKASGATQQAENSDSDFSHRFKSPEDVAATMRFGAKQHVEQHLDVLNATKAMTDVGFDPDHVTFYKNRLRDRVKSYGGIGKANIARHNDEAIRVETTADNAKK